MLTTTHTTEGYRVNATGAQLKGHPKKSISFFKRIFEPKQQSMPEKPIPIGAELDDDLKQRIMAAHKAVKSAKSELALKTSEFEQSNLENSILAIKTQIEILQSEIENTEDKLLSGELKTEDLLRVKDEILAHEKNVSGLESVQNLQHNALDLLNAKLNKAQGEFGKARAAVNDQVVMLLLQDFATKHKDELDTIFMAVAGSYCWPVNTGLYGYPISEFSKKFGKAITHAATLTSTPNQEQSTAFIQNMTEAAINKVINQSTTTSEE